jgi:hypothetical protein
MSAPVATQNADEACPLAVGAGVPSMSVGEKMAAPGRPEGGWDIPGAMDGRSPLGMMAR